MVAVRSTPFLETVFWFSAIVLPAVPVVAVGIEPHGEGLGGGYCTPPNRTRCERSELVLGGPELLKRLFAALQQTVFRAPTRIVVTICNSYLQGYKDLGWC